MKTVMEQARIWADRPVENLLTSNNAKTIKNERFTLVLYLAPANQSGYEVCRGRTKGCTAACLFTAGRGPMFTVMAGRTRKTLQFFEKRDEFMAVLAQEIERAENKHGDNLAIRLNGTSDIAWEDLRVYDGKNIFELFPMVQFYDYTKRVDRLENCQNIANYHLTFSRAETKKSHQDTLRAIELGYSVAVVFEEMPEYYLGLPVIEGDITDERFKDSGQVIVGLKAKGRAKDDDSGFVVKESDLGGGFIPLKIG